MGTIRNKAIFTVMFVIFGTAVTAAPAVLQEMPADAGFILVTEPLAQLSGKLDVLGHQLGLLQPEVPFDLTAMLSANLGISGIDPTRGIGVAAPNILSIQQGVVLYLPVQDAQAAMESLKTTSGATALVGREDILRIPDPGVYVKASGAYLIGSENAEMVASVSQMAKGVKLNAESQKIFETSQCAFLIDIKPLVPMLQMIAQNPAALAGMAGGGMGMPPGAGMNQPPQMPACMTALQQKAFARLGEVELVAGGAQLGTDGITILSHTQAQPGSKLAAFLDHQSTADISKFKTFPNGTFNWTMAIDMDEKAFEPVIQGIMNAIAGDPVASEKIGNENLALLSELLPGLINSHGGAADYTVEPAGGTSATQARTMAWIVCDNAVEKMDLMQKAVPLLSQIMTAVDVPVVLNYKSKSGTIGQKQYDEIVTDLSQIPMPPEQKQAIMAQMGGKLSESAYICRTDMHNIAYATTADQLQELVGFGQSGKPGLDQNPDIVKTAAYLPKQANMYFFVQPGNCVRSMLTKTDPMMMMIFGMFSQLPGMIGSSVTLQDGYVNSQTYIPNEMIQSLVTMIMQMQQQMQPPPGMYPDATGGSAEGSMEPDQTGTAPPSNPPY